jgi:zona occludens toxin
MIYLFTGIPGSSKTLNVIKFVSESEIFKGREVYYHRIKDLKLPWIELTEDEVMSWDTLPHGSVLIVDEAQYLMPTRDSRKSMPDWITKMSEHRHSGYDFIFISQSPMLLDAGFRRFVGKHTHIERVFGLESAKWLTWEKCVADVDDHFKKQEAVVKRVKFDKKYYGVYKSAEVHTHKKRIPLKVFLPVIALILIVGFMYNFVTRWGEKGKQPVAVHSEVSTVAVDRDTSSFGLRSTAGRAAVLTTAEYVNNLSPRLADVPWSAPAYDGLTVPKSFPRPQCIRHNLTGVCKCYTQQSTPLTISETACNNYVENGYFDSSKPDDYNSGEKPEARGEGAGAAAYPRAS